MYFGHCQRFFPNTNFESPEGKQKPLLIQRVNVILALTKGMKKENPEGLDYKRATGIGGDEEFGPSFKGFSSPIDRNRCSFPSPRGDVHSQIPVSG
jgi:hypothetical protein